MVCRHIYIIPLLFALLLLTTFVITYTVAVVLGHVQPDFPYISETGMHSPESCIFGQLLNIGAILGGVVMYLRYRQVGLSKQTTCKPLNLVALLFGWLSSLGVSVVGNFQQNNVFVVHMIGALVCFVGGTIYFVLQAFISATLPPAMTNRLVVLLHVFISFTCVVTLVTSFTIFLAEGPQDLACRVCEWVLAVAFCSFCLTFAVDLRHFHLEAPKMYRVAEPDTKRNDI